MTRPGCHATIAAVWTGEVPEGRASEAALAAIDAAMARLREHVERCGYCGQCQWCGLAELACEVGPSDAEVIDIAEEFGL